MRPAWSPLVSFVLIPLTHLASCRMQHCDAFKLPDGSESNRYAWCIMNKEVSRHVKSRTPTSCHQQARVPSSSPRPPLLPFPGAQAQKKFGLPSLKFYKDNLGLFESAPDFTSLARDVIGCDPKELRATIDEYELAIDHQIDLKVHLEAEPGGNLHHALQPRPVYLSGVAVLPVPEERVPRALPPRRQGPRGGPRGTSHAAAPPPSFLPPSRRTHGHAVLIPSL